ncbi:hypothetical protein LEP1GSC055_1476 [Leptospira borgpetersenii str. Brem 307]|uniref:Lipoprotein n=1 Tax=Leptospira borgpetersenii str. Brem 328 TaxID=1049780 RepID=A0ABC9SH54_LEPBO|nr:hypothetical protein LEP1GSC055_1476 [Leptospira borgpetersenii str. Brem 307]EMN17036.1 hypothetical protein LEP1GSC056_1549 [Leptospira borgpetersenii str. Brem 328]
MSLNILQRVLKLHFTKGSSCKVLMRMNSSVVAYSKES